MDSSFEADVESSVISEGIAPKESVDFSNNPNGIPQQIIDAAEKHLEVHSSDFYCVVCNMHFKTQESQNRHNKFSELHLKLVNGQGQGQAQVGQGQNGQNGQSQSLSHSASAPAVPIKKASISQETVGETSPHLAIQTAVPDTAARLFPGQAYRLIHTGSKMFWRTRDTIDISLYQHFQTLCVEVVSYDPQTMTEFPRIYLSVPVLYANFEYVAATVIQQRKDMALEGFVTDAVDLDKALDDARRPVMTKFISSRLQLEVIEGKKVFMYQLASTDEASKNPLLPQMPNGLEPVKVQHQQRRHTHDEVATALDDMEKQREELHQATEKAEHSADNVRLDNFGQVANVVADVHLMAHRLHKNFMKRKEPKEGGDQSQSHAPPTHPEQEHHILQTVQEKQERAQRSSTPVHGADSDGVHLPKVKTSSSEDQEGSDDGTSGAGHKQGKTVAGLTAGTLAGKGKTSSTATATAAHSERGRSNSASDVPSGPSEVHLPDVKKSVSKPPSRPDSPKTRPKA